MELIEALEAGLPVLLPTDTGYGLAAAAAREEDTARLYAPEGRQSKQPPSLLARRGAGGLPTPTGAETNRPGSSTSPARSRASSGRAPRQAATRSPGSVRPFRPSHYDRPMAVAQQTFDELRTAGLADIDPEIAELLGRELERQRGQIELIA